MIRRAVPEDAAAIAALEDWSADQLRATLELETSAGWVVCEPEVVGHVLVSSVADTGEVLLLAVRDDQRRRGLGGTLLAEAERHWRRTGVVEAWLEVRADNTGAIALYAGRGWARQSHRRAYYRDGTDALMMRWTP